MRVQLASAFRRLCLGTARELEWLYWWLTAKNRVPNRHSLRSDLAWIGHALGRLVLAAGALAFWGQLLTRAPHLIYGVPLAWAASAWQMSDWSATPPPRGVAADSDIDARRRRAQARGVQDPNGVMCIIHPPAVPEPEEVNQR
ncbi:hypothetical protein [Streptomyces luteocolor]|uniref:hypothetical protein n=1 Tax=Streptomyces luteocolor TaxID=285500 RepID=UPI000853A298|nr:hypothetical protein [Streptomyces luteocolor]